PVIHNTTQHNTTQHNTTNKSEVCGHENEMMGNSVEDLLRTIDLD
ncbi:hypothetical protein THAOC_29180, partial [Thalassiosira oceanica]